MNFTTKIYCEMQAFAMTKLAKYAGIMGASGFLTLALPAVRAFATDGGEIASGINNGAQQLWKILIAIVAPIATVFFAWAAFKAVFGGERGMEAAKATIITIVIVIALVLLAPLAVKQITTWFESSSKWAF